MGSSSNRKSGSSGRSRSDSRDRARRPAAREGRAVSAEGRRLADSKREVRDRMLAERKKHTRRRIGVLGVAILLVLAGTLSLWRSSLFTIEQVEVAGVENLTKARVLEVAQVPEDATLLRFPGSKVKERLEAEPWVREANVTRDFPDTMRIRITERKPVALVDLGQEYLLVDGAGWLIETRALEETVTLPVIRDVAGLDTSVMGRKTTSEPLLNALAVYRELSGSLRAQVRGLSASTIDETTLLTNEGIEIFVGEAVDVEKKSAVAMRILEEQAGRAVFIDVRSPERPIFRSLGE